jgi:hypothetical protein
MPQGDLVLLRTSGDRPATRRIWEVRPREVLVVHDDYYRRWERHRHLLPQTFSIVRDRLFQPDTDLAQRLGALFARTRHGDADAQAGLHRLWDQAVPLFRD